MSRFALVVCIGWTALGASAVSAEPIVERDGRFQADVSAKEMSRIAIAGEKVASVRKIDEPEGPKMIVEADATTGEFYVAFDGDVAGRAFSAFITTQSGKTVQAVLSPRPIEAQSVVVKLDPAEARPPQTTEAEAAAPPPVDGRTDRHEGYSEILTALIRLMFNQVAAPGVELHLENDRTRRAGAFELQTLETYAIGGLRGTVLQLQNKTEVGQALSGRTFLVPGVLAAAVSHETVQPGQYAHVYIVEAAQ